MKKSEGEENETEKGITMESERMNVLHVFKPNFSPREKYLFPHLESMKIGENSFPVHYSMVRHCYINERKHDEVTPQL